MNNSPELRDGWTPCPIGTLSTLAGNERRRRRRRFLIQSGGVAGAVVLTFGFGWSVFRGNRKPDDPIHGGIACSRVREIAREFVQGQLDDKVNRQIRIHLEECERCRILIESMQVESTVHLGHGDSSENCLCLTCRRDQLVELLMPTQPDSIVRMT